jgi:hypothetical protein
MIAPLFYLLSFYMIRNSSITSGEYKKGKGDALIDKKALEATDSNAFYLLYSNIAQGSHKTGSVPKSSSLL